MAKIIQLVPDALAAAAQVFAKRAEYLQHLHWQVQAHVEQLRGGGWTGVGAESFYAEMKDVVSPALQRLVDALQKSVQSTQSMVNLLQRAEEEAAALFFGESESEGRGRAEQVAFAQPVTYFKSDFGGMKARSASENGYNDREGTPVSWTNSSGMHINSTPAPISNNALTSTTCPWANFDTLKGLVPQLYSAAQRWNREQDTGLSDTAFVAYMIAHLDREDRVRTFGARWVFDAIGDLATSYGYDGTVGLANIRLSTVYEILNGKIPLPDGRSIDFDHTRSSEIFQRIWNAFQADRMAAPYFAPLERTILVLSDAEVSIELLAANTLRGIIRAQEIGVSPSMANLASWSLAGIQSQDEYNRSDRKGEIDVHVSAILEKVQMLLPGQACDMGLQWSTNPSGEFNLGGAFTRDLIN